MQKLEWLLDGRLKIEQGLVRHPIYLRVCCLGCKSDVLGLDVLETGALPLDHLSYLLVLLGR